MIANLNMHMRKGCFFLESFRHINPYIVSVNVFHDLNNLTRFSVQFFFSYNFLRTKEKE